MQTETISIESHYAKQNDVVYYYWRIVGSKEWNVQPTALKNVPYIELPTQPSNTEVDKK